MVVTLWWPYSGPIPWWPYPGGHTLVAILWGPYPGDHKLVVVNTVTALIFVIVSDGGIDRRRKIMGGRRLGPVDGTVPIDMLISL
jgi:hypothetical protein